MLSKVLTREDLIRLKQEEKTDKEIAQLYNLTHDYVVYLKEKFQLPKERPGRKRKIKISREQLLELQNELKIDRLIAERLQVTTASIAALRRRYDIPMVHKGDSEKILKQDENARVKFLFNRIVDIRREKKIKQYDFAQMLGISPAYLRRTEHGMVFPPLKLFLKIINVLRINPRYIFMESETRKYLE
jgi:DNA-binding XRE family transcriptional regulator